MRYFSVKAIVMAMTLAPLLSHAADSLDHVAATCSESLTILQGESLSFQCTGDLSVSGDGDGVRLLADRSVSFSATGRLSIDRLNIISPEIFLNAGGAVDIGRSVVLFTPDRDPNRPPLVQLVSGSGSISIRPELTPISGSLTLSSQGNAGTLNWSAVHVSNVPEPTVGLLAIAGIGTLLIRRRRA